MAPELQGPPEQLTCNIFYCGIINKTVQIIPMMGLNVESTVRGVYCSTDTLLTAIQYSKQFVAMYAFFQAKM